MIDYQNIIFIDFASENKITNSLYKKNLLEETFFTSKELSHPTRYP